MVKKDDPRCGSVNKPLGKGWAMLMALGATPPPPPAGEKSNEVPGERRIGCRRMQR
jgi:hypothetical protein